MKSHDLTREQLDALLATLRPMSGYLNRLQDRMQKTGFSSQDPVYLQAVKAADVMQSLVMKLHYLGCKGSVGAPANEPQPNEPQ